MAMQRGVLSLRVLARGGWSHDRPSLEAFVDGTRLGEGSTKPEFTGHYPSCILSTDRPLLAAGPRRVSLLCCDCGEWGCAEIAPLVRRDGDRVVWADFRLFKAASLDPERPEDPSRGEPLGWDDLSFDVDEYMAEVERATADRSWAPINVATALLIKERLLEEAPLFASAGFKVTGALIEPGADTASVILADAHGKYLRLALRLAGSTAEERARGAAAALLAAPPSTWRAAFGGPKT